MNNPFRFLLATCLLSSFIATAQVTEAQLSRLGQSYLLPENEPYRDSLAEIFADSLWDFISVSKHYGATLKSVRNLSVQLPEDRSFALYTWAVPKASGEFSFHGFLWNPQWKDSPRLVLEDAGTIDAPYRWLKGGEFVGGICYTIKTTRYRGEKHYTLLTFRPGRTVNTKFIDAIELGSKRSKVHFGSRIFNIRYNGDERYQRRPYRVQFRYNSSLTAAVRWDKKHRGFICDHLSPSQEGLEERWFAYGPDFSYDRIYWSNGKWELDEAYPLVQNLEVAPTNNNVPTTLDPKK